MKLSRIAGIETTTYCNMDCSWCANSLIEDRDMDEDMFDMVLRVLKLFPAGIIAMNGCGEPLMDPDIFERIDRVRFLDIGQLFIQMERYLMRFRYRN